MANNKKTKKNPDKKKKHNTVKRTYRDSIFRSLFNNEQALRELYGALTDSKIGENEQIEIVTLENAVHNDLKNDLAFRIEMKIIVMIEQQSTDSPNLPIRMFSYLAREYENVLDEKVYGTTPVILPKPELYVFYNGKDDREEEWEQRLSDLFAVEQDDPAAEVIVKVININYDKGAELLEKSRILKGYSILLHEVQANLNDGYDLESAMEIAINYCIEENLNADYLKKNGGVVMNILRQNLTEEQKKNLWEGEGYSRGRTEGYSKGRTEGYSEGRTEEREELTRGMKANGIALDIIHEITGMSKEAIEAL